MNNALVKVKKLSILNMGFPFRTYLLSGVTPVLGGEGGCSGIIEGATAWETAHEECIKSNQVDDSNMGNITLNSTLEELDFDDNCFVQCVYGKVGLLTADGTLDKEKTSSIFKGNITETVTKKATILWNDCIDESAKIGKSKAFGECKVLSLHDFCFNKGIVDAGFLEDC